VFCIAPLYLQARDVEAACKAGIARCTLQLGDIRAGRAQALQLNNQVLFKECALILEG
jgi:WD repeat-containing protein 19